LPVARSVTDCAKGPAGGGGQNAGRQVSRTRCSRSAFEITHTELNDIAAAAIIGDS
jgi:hypothetical protein